MAEREGFEPPIRLPVCRISSAVHSTTLPPLHQGRKAGSGAPRRGASHKRKPEPKQALRRAGLERGIPARPSAATLPRKRDSAPRSRPPYSILAARPVGEARVAEP